MILIALGSNLGDRAAAMAQAEAAMVAAGITIAAASASIQSPALLADDAPPEWNLPFLNKVVAVETAMGPAELLAALKTIERGLGRNDRGHWAPRIIDLDLIAYHDLMVETRDLTLPHPEMHRRDFVLRPLAEIAPHWRHPVTGATAAEMLDRP